MNYDVFICHASEDKDQFVRPLAEALRDAGLEVWYDEFSLKLGDSLRKSIDRGLASSRYGVVVLSPSFFEKHWPQEELNGLAQREVDGKEVILPVWHNVGRDDVLEFSPMLSDRLAAKSSDGIDAVVGRVTDVVGAEPGGGEDTIATRPEYKHRIPLMYEGSFSFQAGTEIEVRLWAPTGSPGEGGMRAFVIADPRGEWECESSTSRVVSTLIKFNHAIQGRIAGPIRYGPSKTEFELEVAGEEYARFVTHRDAARTW